MKGIISFLFVVGCGGSVLPADESPCTATSIGDSVALEETSSLGFSAAEVLDPLGGTFTLAATDAVDGSVENHDVTYTLSANRSAQVVERPDHGTDNPYCLAGQSLAIEARMDVVAQDGWFSGSGPIAISATAADTGHTWVTGAFDVSPSADLAALAAARCSDCDEAAITLQYLNDPSIPRSEQMGVLELVSPTETAWVYVLAPE
jgi:hypothetical protein